MIFVTHPYEDDSIQLMQEREKFGKFLTLHIANFFPDEVVFNFPLNWILLRKELALKTDEQHTIQKSLEILGKADAVLFLNFPGRELCTRSDYEKKAARRLDIPFAEFPFYRHRFEQQLKQNALLTEQKRVLNLLRSSLQNT